MPYINRISGGSARKFGLTRRSSFYLCGTHTAIVTLNNTDKKCYYHHNNNRVLVAIVEAGIGGRMELVLVAVVVLDAHMQIALDVLV
jgi:hypothetical protein